MGTILLVGMFMSSPAWSLHAKPAKCPSSSAHPGTGPAAWTFTSRLRLIHARLRRCAQPIEARRSAVVFSSPPIGRLCPLPRFAGVPNARCLLLGANTPCKRLRLTRGLATGAPSACFSVGVNTRVGTIQSRRFSSLEPIGAALKRRYSLRFLYSRAQGAPGEAALKLLPLPRISDNGLTTALPPRFNTWV